ncbi:MAG: sigma-70 family RNA polymerase sigma factor [Planctomycetota bacterium]
MVFEQQESTFDKQQLMSLVLAAQDGDRYAFEALVERYQRAVYLTVLGRLRNEAEAQELCQEVFLQAMRKIGQLRDPLSFGGWLRSIANRMAINRAVRTRPMARLDCEQSEPRAAGQETPLEEVLAQEQREQVHTGLRRLSELDRATLLAFYFRGRSLVEMSDEFDSPVGTIKRRLHVARKRLAKELATLAPA